MAHRIYWVLIAVSFLFSCETSTHENKEASPSFLKSGDWLLEFDISDSLNHTKVPVRLMADGQGNMSIWNDGEEIKLVDIEWSIDSFHTKIPLFQSFLSGKKVNDSIWIGTLEEPTRAKDYKIPFVAKWFKKLKKECAQPVQKKYDVTFSKGNKNEEYKAVGVFNFCDQQVTGTFLTETGDYRFLEGVSDGRYIWLSCFDGAHLFYFEAVIDGDSLKNGKFFSGKHWTEPWEGKRNEKATLTDPETLTTIVDQAKEEFEFVVLAENRDSVKMDRNTWAGKVTIVQLFGSWCPNCTDESKFFKDLQNTRGEQGLQIIPVAFERGEDHSEHVKNVTQQFTELGITYPPYFGIGDGAGKAKAELTFPMLNHVMSFPTSIVIDKKGVVRKIHTGFYGPSTGEYYERYTAKMVAFIDDLLQE